MPTSEHEAGTQAVCPGGAHDHPERTGRHPTPTSGHPPPRHHDRPLVPLSTSPGRRHARFLQPRRSVSLLDASDDDDDLIRRAARHCRWPSRGRAVVAPAAGPTASAATTESASAATAGRPLVGPTVGRDEQHERWSAEGSRATLEAQGSSRCRHRWKAAHLPSSADLRLPLFPYLPHRCSLNDDVMRTPSLGHARHASLRLVPSRSSVFLACFDHARSVCSRRNTTSDMRIRTRS